MHARVLARTPFCIGGVRGPVACKLFSSFFASTLHCNAHLVQFWSLGVIIQPTHFYSSLVMCYAIIYTAKYKLAFVNFAEEKRNHNTAKHFTVTYFNVWRSARWVHEKAEENALPNASFLPLKKAFSVMCRCLVSRHHRVVGPSFSQHCG